MYQKGLADFIREKMQEKNLSTYAIARNSGGKINANTITRILNGDSKEAKLSTLEAIAKGLGVGAIELFRLAQGRSPDAIKKRAEILIEAFDGDGIPIEEIEAIEKMLDVWFEQKRRQIKANKAINKFEKEERKKK